MKVSTHPKRATVSFFLTHDSGDTKQLQLVVFETNQHAVHTRLLQAGITRQLCYIIPIKQPVFFSSPLEVHKSHFSAKSLENNRTPTSSLPTHREPVPHWSPFAIHHRTKTGTYLYFIRAIFAGTHTSSRLIGSAVKGENVRQTGHCPPGSPKRSRSTPKTHLRI